MAAYRKRRSQSAQLAWSGSESWHASSAAAADASGCARNLGEACLGSL